VWVVFKISVVVTPVEAVFEAVAKIGSLQEAARKASEYGLDGLELSLLDPKVYEPKKLMQILGKYGLEIPAFSTGLNYLHYGYSLSSRDPMMRDAAVKRLKEFIDLAEPLGAGVIIGLMRGKTSKSMSKEEAYRLMGRELKEVCRYAEEKKVEIFFEPLNRYETDLVNTVEEGLKLLEEVDSTALKLLLDTFHMNIEEPIIEESIKRAAGKIGHFHVADSNRLAPGMGHIDFTSVLKALKEAGYRGFLSAEVIIEPSFEKVLEYTVNTLKNAMRGL